VKRYETRSRPTKVRGRIAIHAGRAVPRDIDLVGTPALVIDVPRAGRLVVLHQQGRFDLEPCPLGAVVATAELVDCVRTEDTGTPTLERRLGDWTPGRWAWELADVRPLEEPVPARGALGWWDWTPPEGVA
jgi:hypothetical protein